MTQTSFGSHSWSLASRWDRDRTFQGQDLSHLRPISPRRNRLIFLSWHLSESTTSGALDSAWQGPMRESQIQVSARTTNKCLQTISFCKDMTTSSFVKHTNGYPEVTGVGPIQETVTSVLNFAVSKFDNADAYLQGVVRTLE